MPSSSSAAEAPLDNNADLAKAFQELAKGERAAAAMESQLTALERKIDDLLASVDEQDQSPKPKQPSSEASSSN